MTFPFFISCYAKNCNPKVTTAALNMLQRLLCGEKASRSSFCPPYGTIVLVMPHEAAPSRVLLLALLVENKLLVSKGKREARGHRGTWDEGGPVRMATRLHPMVSGQPEWKESSEQGKGNSAAYTQVNSLVSVPLRLSPHHGVHFCDSIPTSHQSVAAAANFEPLTAIRG